MCGGVIGLPCGVIGLPCGVELIVDLLGVNVLFGALSLLRNELVVLEHCVFGISNMTALPTAGGHLQKASSSSERPYVSG